MPLPTVGDEQQHPAAVAVDADRGAWMEDAVVTDPHPAAREQHALAADGERRVAGETRTDGGAGADPQLGELCGPGAPSHQHLAADVAVAREPRGVGDDAAALHHDHADAALLAVGDRVARRPAPAGGPQPDAARAGAGGVGVGDLHLRVLRDDGVERRSTDPRRPVGVGPERRAPGVAAAVEEAPLAVLAHSQRGAGVVDVEEAAVGAGDGRGALASQDLAEGAPVGHVTAAGAVVEGDPGGVPVDRDQVDADLAATVGLVPAPEPHPGGHPPGAAVVDAGRGRAHRRRQCGGDLAGQSVGGLRRLLGLRSRQRPPVVGTSGTRGGPQVDDEGRRDEGSHQQSDPETHAPQPRNLPAGGGAGERRVGRSMYPIRATRPAA